MHDNVIFRSAAFGFDKREVMEYISSICEVNAENIRRLNGANAEIAKCRQESENFRNENAELVAKNKALEEEIAENQKLIESLNEKITELTEKAEKVNEIEGAEEKANQLMMDSLRYSESCIKNAQRVSESLNISTKNKIDKAKSCLNTVSSDFKSLTGQLEQSISEISQRLAELSKGLDDSGK
ncbi:MAG: hypothetical protein IJ279_05030 [Clostridia bacterium]|nr:hypothetical protein [Clostridia bacterium]